MEGHFSLKKYLLSVSDLKARARRRMPHFAWEYLDSGTAAEECLARNRAAFQQITLAPKFLKGKFTPNLQTKLFGTDYAAPFGISPVGLSSLMWPKAEVILAQTASQCRIPYGLSTVGTESPEVVGSIAGDMGWFQLYSPRDLTMRQDLLDRAWNAGFRVLLVTADVPIMSRRERQIKAGLSVPPRITPRTLYHLACSPSWSFGTLRAGQPRFKVLEKYADDGQMRQMLQFTNDNLSGTLSWDYLEEVRALWKGALVLKGVLHPEDASRAVAVGVDGVQVSNHGGRQLDGAPATMEVLPEIKAAVGAQTKVLLDSGVRSGLDIARAIAVGADFVLLGRAFLWGVGALGREGGAHTVSILTDELTNVMTQLGCATVAELSQVDWSKTPLTQSPVREAGLSESI